jgi:hypothetical protein
MAKLKMLCPYSHQLCKECSLFRGRHYYLCFCKNYRGYLGEETDEKTSVRKVPREEEILERNKEKS